MVRWHCPPDTGFEIRALAVWGRARYLSVTEAPHNTAFHTWMGKKHFCFLQTAETGNRTPDSSVKGSSANHYPRAPAQRRYTVLNFLNSALTWSHSHIEKGKTMLFLWKPYMGTAVVEPGTQAWLARQSGALAIAPSPLLPLGGGSRVVVSTAAFHARVWGSVPGLGGFKETKMFLLHPRVKVSIVGSLRDREVACSASDRQGSNFESCVWRTVSSQSSHHPQEVLLAQFSL